MKSPLDRAVDLFDGKPSLLAAQLEVTQQRLGNWFNRGLPVTELTGETSFAEIIERQCALRQPKKGVAPVTKAELLEWSFPKRKQAAA